KEGKEEIVIDINHPKMASLGISTEDVARTLKIAYDGELVTSLQTLEKKIEYRVLLNEKSRKRADLIKNLSIKNMSGSLVKLGTFISFSTKPSNLEIYRRNGIRSISITGEVKPKHLTAMEAAKYIDKNLIKEWDIPENLDIEIGGEAQKSKEIMKDVGIAVIIAIIFIFFTLAVSLNSWLTPLIIMSSVPFSIIGVIFALIIHGQNISMFVFLAVIGLTGVIVNDSIVMVNGLNKASKMASDLKEDALKQIVSMAKTRLRPILLTTITTLSGLMPMAYGLGGYEKMISPLSLAFAWGLLFATLITLFLIPALYMIINDLQGRKAGR
ncbi:MAG: efflux RND transporter permease subunit, partial [Elusimicrobiota bacterium]|nr:efflux RND transporter permease subunit [Elusimicrobiota bacterium]